ncbi:MAG: hypothetical protein DRO07_02325 [Candidatus Iainarchaeum archaeon]|mgnify:CR=1 FL=1|uniref:DNA 3'-5' helicase n=1 Tax=Candidatus Iainarchaeum sp. TaxID=3101447 RepID=A0A497JFI1_9ARCH|nr:MAG: hypothetical protein DRO07_02325 [Candidatus Diapherotrites archaeon]
MFDSEANIEEIKKSFQEALARLDKYIEKLQLEKERIAREFSRKLEHLRFFIVDREALKNFLDEPYVLIPKRKDEWYVIVPKFIPIHLGWLEHETRSFRVYVINKYFQWIYELPDSIKKRIRLPEPLPFKVIDGYLHTGRKLQEVGWQKYKKFLYRKEGSDRIRIKKGYEFQLIAQLIEDGCLPFIPQPVDETDLREWAVPDELKELYSRSYIQNAWKEFLCKGAIGVYWAFGAGKSMFGLYALARIKGRKLVVVPTLTLKEQWTERIRKFIPQSRDEIDIVTYRAYNKVKDKEYTLTIYDECHRLPANTYIRLSTIKTKYRLGLSGSPFREDKRESYIFALTGFPVGLNWDELIRLKVVTVPTFKLYLVKTYHNKLRKLDELLKIPVKTIVFCDSIKLGKQIASRYGIPFVYGETKDRLQIIRESDVCVVSRVGDEGISVGDIERVIEVAFLAGSRRQEAQRFGRLMHTQEEEPEHIIIMTEKEFELYQKRLYAITEKGFRIEIIR